MPLRLYAYLAGFVAVLGLGWAVHHRIDSGGYDRCKDELALASAASEKAETDKYLAALAWGNQVSEKLAQQQRENQRLRDEHDEVASNLIGTCPVGLRFLHDAAAFNVPLSDPARASLGSPATVDASWIGKAVSANYGRYHDCAAQLNALITFFEGTEHGDKTGER